jgi:hypothetical protein
MANGTQCHFLSPMSPCRKTTSSGEIGWRPDYCAVVAMGRWWYKMSEVFGLVREWVLFLTTIPTE